MSELKDFQIIPGVGKSMARNFIDLGYEVVAELIVTSDQKQGNAARKAKLKTRIST